MEKMSNVKLVKNDAFYNAEFDIDIFLYWMIKWLNVETTNNSSKMALKNMAKKFIEEILGEKLDTEDIEIHFSNKNYYSENGSFIDRILGDCPILLILNRNQNGNRKYIYFRDFSYYEYSKDFNEYNGKLIKLLKKYENLKENEENNVKIVHFSSDLISRYEKEEVEEISILYDKEKFLTLFENSKKYIDDSIFDSYYNQIKQENKKNFGVNINENLSLYLVLESYINKKFEDYDVYRCFDYIKWLKHEFFIECFCVNLIAEDKKTNNYFLLKWFNNNKVEEKTIKLIQKELKDIFPDFKEVNYEDIDCENNEIPLMCFTVNLDSSLKDIKKMVDKITEKIEKFNKMKNCRDIREEYVEYFEEKRLKKRFRSNRKIRKKF